MPDYGNLPNNTQAERAVLGACLLSEESLEKVMEILKPSDFFDTNNKIAYEILLDMFNHDKKIDFVTVLEEMKSRNVSERLGGQPFIAELMSDISVIANVSHHAKIVKAHSVRRDFILAGQKITTLAYRSDIEISELISGAEKLILDTSLSKGKNAPAQISDLTPSAIEQIIKTRSGELKQNGFKTNFVDLDKIVTLQPGSLNIIAARPSMGKTALALNIAQFGGDIAKNNPVLIFSLEMSKEQLLYRMFAAEAEVNLSGIISGELDDYELERVQEAAETLDKRKIFIQETADLSVSDFRAKCRRFKAQHPNLALIVVDYIQLMNAGKKSDNRAYEVAEISRVLKSVAVELDCPVIALSQLSREAEKRTEKRPQLSDLRDSGAIEQDADVVILLFREDYYKEAEEKSPQYSIKDSKADLRIAKNRNGRTGMCSLTFTREFTKFMNYAEEY